MLTRTIAAASASIALVATGVTPALAAPVAHAPVAAEHDSGWSDFTGAGRDDSVQLRRYYRGHRHRGGVDGGDILAGALIIGGIAAIASAANNNKRRSYPRGYDYRDNGLNAAADQCSYAAEANFGRGSRVNGIDVIARDGAGYRVEGSIGNGGSAERFYCGVTAGRVDYIEFDRGLSRRGSAQDYDERYDDDDYSGY